MKKGYLLTKRNILAKLIFLGVFLMFFVSVSAENPLVSYTFEDETFNPTEADAKITATPIASSSSANLSFVIFEETEIDEVTEEEMVVNRGIRDHGQGPDHINAFNESEALLSLPGNQKCDFLTFTVTPNPAHTLKLNSLSFDLQARNGKQSGDNLRYRAGLYSSKTGFGFTNGDENDRIGDYAEAAAIDLYSATGWLHFEFELDELVFERDESIEFRIYIWRDGPADPRDERWMEFDNVYLYGISDATGVSNFPPEITAIDNQVVLYGSSSEVIDFVVSDTESAAQNLVVTVESDNEEVIPVTAIAITQPDASGNASIVLTPIAGGIANITVIVTDEGGDFISETFELTVNIIVTAAGEGVSDELFEGYFANEELPVPAPRLGWLFAGWYLSGDFSGEALTSIDISCTLHAKWDKTITVIAAGKTISNDFFAGYVPGDELPVPVRQGFHFDGWYLSADFSGEPVTSVTDDCTLYAHWLQIILTPYISYTFDDGSFDPIMGEDAGQLVATEISNKALSFEIFEEIEIDEETGEETAVTGIRDHGQGPDHINALTEGEATNPGGNEKNNYLTFMLEPDLGESIRLAKLTFDIQARTGEPSFPPELTYYASVYSSKPRPDVTNIWTDPRNRLGEIAAVSSNELNSIGGWQTIECDLSHIQPEIDELVEFRIFFWRVGDTNQRSERWVEIDNIILYGALLQEEEPSAIKNVKPQATVSLYPNPAKESIVIEGLAGGETISLIGLDGRIWNNTTATNDKENISVNNLSKGTYLVSIAGAQGVQTLKLIVNN